MNSFDLEVYAALAVAIGFGFRTGLLGSAMTILAYLLAAPIAVALMPLIVPQVATNPNAPLLQNWMWFFGIFVVVGMLLGYIGRLALNDTIREAGIGDRLAGAALGAIRVGLVAHQGRPRRHHAGAGVRSDRAGQPPAAVPRRFASAAAILGGRQDGLQDIAAGGRGRD
ncbi:hypothetical protein ACVMHY_009564 [Bradyrhizobium barranii subsp. barranii]